jgi:opacity protein-like surface antigen
MEHHCASGKLGVARVKSARLQTSCMALCVAAIPAIAPSSSRAAEYTFGSYALGVGLPMAGYLPAPGVYFTDIVSFYKGSAAANLTAPFGNNLAVGLRAKIVADAEALTWVTEAKILGGSLAFSFAGGFGKPVVFANEAFTGPLGVDRQINISDSTAKLGDSGVSAILGWQEGNHHWSVTATGVIPTGFYDPDRLAFVGLNRPGVDLKGAYTYFDPKAGFEFSGALGMTFNYINRITQYKTGDELHAEAALIGHMETGSKSGVIEIRAGAGGYVYQQVTNDSGPGDKVGPFRGRTVAAGPILGFTFMAGQTPVSVNAEWFHEIEVENRLKGNAAYLTMSVPLQVYAAEAAAAKKTASAVYKAPPVAYVEPSWTGFYIGANAGGVWSRSDLHWTTSSFGLLPGGAAEAAAIDTAAAGKIESSGFVGGGQVGFNYQTQWVVFGIEADFNGIGMSGSRTATAVPPVGVGEPIAETFNSHYLATLRGRLGVAAGSWLVYGTGGAASERVDYEDTIAFPLLGSRNAASSKYIAAGFTAGGGVERMLTSNWSVKAEYLHIDLGHKVKKSFNSAHPLIGPIILHDHRLAEDLIRVGVNYRFVPTGSVTAKY